MTESTEQIGKDIEALDREARDALDRLADRREELEQRHRETDLAAQRQREREQERRSQEAREAEERTLRRRREEAERLGSKRLELEERAEREASVLAATLEELVALDPAHTRALMAAHGQVPDQVFSRTFGQVLREWFESRFRGVVPGIGGEDLRGGLSLPERDARTPPKGSYPEPAPAGGEGAAESSQSGTEG